MGIITKDRLKDVMRGIERMEKEPVLVGVPEGKTAREGSGPTNAQIGYWMEYGVPSVNIPARPWLMPGIKKAEPKIIKSFEKAAHAAFDGDAYKYEQAITQVGNDAVNTIKYRITSGIAPPLAPSTIHQRRTREKRPRFGVTPLIDTTAFLGSINFTLKGQQGA